LAGRSLPPELLPELPLEQPLGLPQAAFERQGRSL
jgi:hypothetical protein